MQKDSFGCKDTLTLGEHTYHFYNLETLEQRGLIDLATLPFSIRVLLENLLRNEDGRLIKKQHIESILDYDAASVGAEEIPYMPARVVMQDFTGVPAVVDLAAMRDAMAELGGKPEKINPQVPSDLVIDHSVQVDAFGVPDAYTINTRREYERNSERYALLRWAQESLDNFSVVPPATGIVHQVNLEYLAQVVISSEYNGAVTAYPDTLVGTDSHTTMINGLSVLGWGVGGIEAEAVVLGQPYYMLLPEVIGVKLSGQLREGATATDLVLTVTEMLRKHGVVGKFVEFFGPGLSTLPLADRATIANMSPEYGATMGFFPIDEVTLEYLRFTGRSEEQVQLVDSYAKRQGLFRTDETPDPVYTDTLYLDLAAVEPSLAGPYRPQDRIPMKSMKKAFDRSMEDIYKPQISSSRNTGVEFTIDGTPQTIGQGAVVIAAITSCTNTSNPSVMIGAGLLAKKALEKGVMSKPWVKTSLAPGSQVVPEYLEKAGLMEPLEKQGFGLVAFGCTTCIGNSGPLPEEIENAIREGDLVAASVLSGNRNFEGRIHPLVRANYLASPPLVVAYALAGRVDIDLENEPLGKDAAGNPVYLNDIWPSQEEILQTVQSSLNPDMFNRKYSDVFEGDELWQSLHSSKSEMYQWDTHSTYIKRPPFFEGMGREPGALDNIEAARVIALLGDTVTTDHISPAGSIPQDSPAGRYLLDQGVAPEEFNTYGSRRGNHEVMMRGTFANIRIKNRLVPGVEGGYTVHFPTGKQMFIYDACMQYQQEDTPLIVLAGKEYGTGSSRDWAAKGTRLLGIQAVIAESFERIHRSNLLGMGVLPLQFLEGEGCERLGLSGKERYTIEGIAEGLSPGKEVTVRAVDEDGQARAFSAVVRLDTEIEVEYYRNGGILQTVIRELVR
jgi:aconitate hydratase